MGNCPTFRSSHRVGYAEAHCRRSPPPVVVTHIVIAAGGFVQAPRAKHLRWQWDLRECKSGIPTSMWRCRQFHRVAMAFALATDNAVAVNTIAACIKFFG